MTRLARLGRSLEELFPERHLYVRYGTGYQELYAYRRDPYELHNRAGDPAFDDVLRRLRRRTNARCMPAPPDYGRSVRSRSSPLGDWLRRATGGQRVALAATPWT